MNTFCRLTICGLFIVFAPPIAFTQDVSPIASQSGAPAIPSYPNSAKGLEKFVKDMLTLMQAGNAKSLAAYAKSLSVPDPHAWYKSVFGEYVGLQLAEAAEPLRSDIQESAQSTISTVFNQKMTDIQVVRFTDSCNDLATPLEYPILALREHPEPFYDVRFRSNPTTGAVWGFFAYIDGGFRYVGDIQKGLPPHFVPRAPEQSKKAPGLKVPGNVQSAKMIHYELPVYPMTQKRQRHPGNVILHAIVAKDGTIQELNVIEGECAFVRASLEAVKKWRYSPTLLNGDPVDVDTTITVQFAMH